MTAASFAEVLSPLAGFAVSLTGALPARGMDVPFTEHVISTAANDDVGDSQERNRKKDPGEHFRPKFRPEHGMQGDALRSSWLHSIGLEDKTH